MLMKNNRHANCSKTNMALLKCKECGKDVSSKAATCTSCGASVRRKKGRLRTFAILFFVLIGIGSLARQSDNSSSTAAKPVRKTQANANNSKKTSLSDAPTRKTTDAVPAENEADRILKQRADNLAAEQKTNVINYAPASADAYDADMNQALAEKNYAKFRALRDARNKQYPEQVK
jgi:hypothetical protein